MSEQTEPLEQDPIGAEFDRTDLAYAIAEKTGLSPVEAKVAIEGLAKVLPDALVGHGGRIEIHGLGVFRLEDRAPRKGAAPGGQPFETGNRQEIVFHAAPVINQIVTERTGVETYSA